MSEKIIRVLLVDDHQMILDSLSMLLSSRPHISIAGKFTDGRKVLPFLKSNEVDLIITDSRMPELSGIDLVKQLLDNDQGTRIIMVSMVESPEEIRLALEVGVRGYLSKSVGVDELFMAITRVMEGKKYLSNEIIVSLSSPSSTDKGEAQRVKGLTARELEVLQLIAQEHSSSEIAERLNISVPTVETHRKNLFQKAGVKTAIGLVLFAIRNNLLEGVF